MQGQVSICISFTHSAVTQGRFEREMVMRKEGPAGLSFFL
jgi:hypothetical protein